MMARTPSVLLLAAAISVGVAMAAYSEGMALTAQAGGVTASATPTNLNDASAATIDFTVALNTHSFPLAFDMTKIALLSDGKKLTEPPSSWSGGKGGHHLSGTLSFPAADLRKGQTIVLTLTGAGAGKDLLFQWKGPF